MATNAKAAKLFRVAALANASLSDNPADYEEIVNETVRGLKRADKAMNARDRGKARKRLARLTDRLLYQQ